MKAATKPRGSDSVDTLYSVALKVLDEQMKSIESLDAKIHGTFAFITTIFVALTTFIASQSTKFTSISYILFWIIVPVFIALVVFSALAYWVKEYYYLIPANKIPAIADKRFADYAIKSYFLIRIGKQHEFNEAIRVKKGRYAKLVFLFAFIEILLIPSLLVIQTFPRLELILIIV